MKTLHRLFPPVRKSSLSSSSKKKSKSSRITSLFKQDHSLSDYISILVRHLKEIQVEYGIAKAMNNTTLVNALKRDAREILYELSRAKQERAQKERDSNFVNFISAMSASRRFQ